MISLKCPAPNETNEKIAVDECVKRMYGRFMARQSTSDLRSRRPIGLGALRGFEAAARLLSFTTAAAKPGESGMVVAVTQDVKLA